MKYKGYFGEVAYDDKATLFHGQVIGIKDIITFQGKNINDLTKAFQDSINDYLAWCEAYEDPPEKI
jgi:predicted HicB family RNase H-like nuclease